MKINKNKILLFKQKMFRKYGGLKEYLPLTYSVILIASLSLVAFPVELFGK